MMFLKAVPVKHVLEEGRTDRSYFPCSIECSHGIIGRLTKVYQTSVSFLVNFPPWFAPVLRALECPVDQCIFGLSNNMVLRLPCCTIVKRLQHYRSCEWC